MKKKASRTRKQESCAGKVRYAFWPEADRAGRQFRRFRDDVKVQPYHCRFCGGWHLGESQKDNT